MASPYPAPCLQRSGTRHYILRLALDVSRPDSWSWLDETTVEICSSMNILRNEVGFPPMERDCAPFPITGKELDLDGDGTIDLIETFTILDPLFYRERRLE